MKFKNIRINIFLSILLMLTLGIGSIGIHAGHHICNDCGEEYFFMPWQDGEDYCVDSHITNPSESEMSCCSADDNLPEFTLKIEKPICCIVHIDSSVLTDNYQIAQNNVSFEFSGGIQFRLKKEIDYFALDHFTKSLKDNYSPPDRVIDLIALFHLSSDSNKNSDSDDFIS